MPRRKAIVESSDEEEEQDIRQLKSSNTSFPAGTKRKRSKSTGKSQSKRRATTNEDEQESGDKFEASRAEDQDLTASQMDKEFDGRSSPSENVPGIIVTVEVRDFLCHRHLSIDLGPSVNFIHGLNGSGKSAILTAIIVGLGGKASSTARGSKLRDLIRKGATSSVVKVTLRNTGVDAFKSKQYGKKLTVERTIRQDGTSSYKTLNEKNKTVSTGKDELNEILDHFNIQVDNPIAVLNQDNSKSFLTSSKPKDKYAFFKKATQLEDMHLFYKRAANSRQHAKANLEQKKKTLELMAQQTQAAEEAYKHSQKLKAQEEALQSLEHEMVWAEIYETEKAMEKLEEALVPETAKFDKTTEKLDNEKEKVQRFESKRDVILTQLEKANQEVTEFLGKHAGLTHEIAAHKLACKNKQLEKKNIANRKKNTLKEKNELELQIEEQKNATRRNLQGEQAQRAKEMDELEARLQNLQESLRDKRTLAESLDASIRQEENRDVTLSREQAKLNDKRRKVKEDINKFTASKSNRVRLFGAHMPNVLSAIQREKSWHVQPLGPIGMYLSVKHEMWSQAVEKLLGKLMFGFLVHDHHDYGLLKEIFRRCIKQNKPQIFMSKISDTLYPDFKRDVPQCDYPTVFDMLEISHPHVSNILIDHRFIHQTLLIEGRKAATDVMFDRPPRGARQAYTKAGDVAHPGGKFYSNRDTGFPRLAADPDESIRKCQQEESRLNEDAKKLKDERTKLKHQMDSSRKDLGKCRSEMAKLSRDIRTLESQIHELRETEPEPEVDFTDLEEDLTALDTQVQELDEQETQIDEDLKPLLQAVQEAKQKITEFEPTRTRLEQRSVDLEKESEEVTQAWVVAKAQVKKYESRQKESKIHELQSEIDALTAKVTRLRDGAEQKGIPQVETKKSPAAINRDIVAKKKTLKKAQATNGSVEDITRNYYEKMQQLRKVKREYQTLELFIKKLDKSIDKRTESLQQFTHLLAKRISIVFSSSLEQKGFNGEMLFDHKEHTLMLKLQVNPQGQKTDARALSGGERSYSTVAFILALWEVMECPFRCLDEFDVHMDMINRKVSMRLLIDMAKDSQQSRQYILLTPQSLTKEVGSGVNVKVHRLRDPIRGQGTLNFPAENA
eukprot:m.241366 g.241366  ORF g.241366 m.241366 type:complete len:1125 (+) comp26586_c0_seq3:158-3532(+)